MQNEMKFVFRNQKIELLEDLVLVEFNYEILGVDTFAAKWKFPIVRKTNIDLDVLNNLIFNLGMAESISYWKTKIPKTFEVVHYNLDDEQKAWWNKLFFKGLAEFFYVNQINVNINDFISFTTSNSESKIVENINSDISGSLIPLGGGKDSIVTLDLLNSNKENNYFYYIDNPHYPDSTNSVIFDTLKEAGYDSNRLLMAERELDPKLFTSRERGYLSGHTPLSSVIAFSSVVLAYVNGFEYSILSNESSANDDYVSDLDINHQYSKSFEFENDFAEYNRTYLRSGITYFSLLRPFNEYQIAKYFSNLPYLNIFKSCNLGKKEEGWSWCCKCSKCLFTYIILSPFIDYEQLIKVFGEDLLNKETLLEDFNKLCGESPNKPFECVGSRHEVNIAICETIKKRKDNLPYLLEEYIKTKLFNKYNSYENDLINNFNEENLIPREFYGNVERFVEYVQR